MRILYRYLSSDYALEALQEKRWKLGRIPELNDPLDCWPTLVEKTGDDESVWPKMQEQLASIHSRWGVLCFSKKVRDPIMWTHYGYGHSGIALGFDFMWGEDGHMYWHTNNPRTVTYGNERPKAMVFESEENPEAAMDMLEHRIVSECFGHKAKSWKYEAEVRYFLRFSKDCTMKGRHFFAPFPSKSLRRVVIGPHSRVTAEDVRCALISHPGSNTREPVKVLKASLNRTNYRLDLIPLASIG